MAHPQSFFWYDLVTTDRAAAEAFYRAVVGWGAEAWPMQDGATYTIVKAGEHGVAGIMDMPDAVRAGGGVPRWQGYVYAADVDAKTEEVRQAGGTVHRPPTDIPDVGRFAAVADPQGAAFLVMTPKDMDRPLPAAHSPGTVSWHELHSTDWEAAFAFYAARFGWTKDRAVDMGPMGTYQLFAAGGAAIGGMMNKFESTPQPTWLYYFRVPEAEAAAGRVREQGGTVLMGPTEVPGGDWIVQCRDPQGALFAVVAGTR